MRHKVDKSILRRIRATIVHNHAVIRVPDDTVQAADLLVGVDGLIVEVHPIGGGPAVLHVGPRLLPVEWSC